MTSLGWREGRPRDPRLRGRENRTRGWRRGDSGQWWLYCDSESFVADTRDAAEVEVTRVPGTVA
jgi:hypothetical protein